MIAVPRDLAYATPLSSMETTEGFSEIHLNFLSGFLNSGDSNMLFPSGTMYLSFEKILFDALTHLKLKSKHTKIKDKTHHFFNLLNFSLPKYFYNKFNFLRKNAILTQRQNNSIANCKSSMLG